jgi:hypothetical protein
MNEFVNSITQKNLSKDQYVDEVFEKSMIFLHHTAGNSNPFAVVDYWEKVPERVATPFIIGGTSFKNSKWKDGEIVQCFNSSKAGWHLGLKQVDLNRGKPGNKSSTFLNLNTIGIELTNWGFLVEKNGKFKTWAGSIVPDSRIIELDTPFRGYKYWESYTEPQIESARKLLLYLCDKYDIDKSFKGIEIFDIDKRALRGERGIFTHCSVRPEGEKWDIYPHPLIIQMLKSL